MILTLLPSKMSLIKTQILHILKRRLSSTRNLPDHRALIIESFGEPQETIKLKISKPEEVLPDSLGPKQILVQHLAACVNPADINVAQGLYGKKATLPAIIGNEGITRVLEVGSQVKNLQPGDIALGVSTQGYWQSYSVQDDETFYKISHDLDVTTSVQLKVNPCTAYRMMRDYVSMRPGDVMIQNGANSAVGVYAIQLAKHWEIKTINVIRDRPNKCDIIKELKDFGADYVITEEESRNADLMAPILKNIGKPSLFLNCVGGKNASNCFRHLDHGGTSVTYGFMSKQPLMLGAQSMFKDHKIAFFWMSRWYNEREPQKRDEIACMLNELAGMFKDGVLKPKSTTVIEFEDRNEAFNNSNNTKYVFSINK